jgi:SCY1-like protein 1
MWGLGCLIWEAFNGLLPQQSALKDLENVMRNLKNSLFCGVIDGVSDFIAS